MGQKVHPLGFRIGATQDHYSHWFAKPNQYPQLIQEDKLLRDFINRELLEAGIAEINIQRKADRIELEIHAAKPGIIVGRRGVGIDKIRQDLEKLIKNDQRQISINFFEIKNPSCKAKLIAEFISQELEKRIPFRRAVKKAIQKAQRAGVKGIKIQVSGRLNGAEIARSEWVREGSVSLQTLRAEIDYCYYTAQTIYGILGIKVWVSNSNQNDI
jgi:small subunit ribosomal protein S3